jgi:uncharacterized phosphosugar-binding protein
MATPTTLPATFVAGNVLTAAQMNNLRGAFRVLQVVSTTKTDTFATTSTTFTDITGLSATITPSSADSKILIIVSMSGGNTATGLFATTALLRGATQIALGDAAGSRNRAFSSLYVPDTSLIQNLGGVFLDSPATTSATTYKMQLRSTNASYSAVIGRTGADSDSAQFPRIPSTITVMEISA